MPVDVLLPTVVGACAVALSVACLWPQLWLTCVRGHTAGQSASALWVAVVISAGYLAYGLLAGDRVQVTANLLVAAAQAALLTAVLRRRPHERSSAALRRTLPLPALLGGCFAVAFLTVPYDAPLVSPTGP